MDIGKNKLVKINKNFRKKWSVNKALDFFKIREDYNAINNIFNSKKFGKPDDISDTVCQLMAFVYMIFVNRLF